MLTKKIGLSLCTALFAGVMAVMPVCAATTNDSAASTDTTLESIEAQIEAMDKEYEELFNSESEELWIKMEEAEETISEDEYESEDFNEKEFIQNSDSLNDEEKTKITALLDKIDELDQKMNKLCDEREEAEWEAMTDEQKEASKKVDALCEKEAAIFEEHDALWSKLYEAEDQLSAEELGSDSWDEETFIKKTDVFTDAQKDILLKDLEEAEKIDDQIIELENIIYADDIE